MITVALFQTGYIVLDTVLLKFQGASVKSLLLSLLLELFWCFNSVLEFFPIKITIHFLLIFWFINSSLAKMAQLFQILGG